MRTDNKNVERYEDSAGNFKYKNMQRNIASVAEKKLSYTFFWLDDEND